MIMAENVHRKILQEYLLVPQIISTDRESFPTLYRELEMVWKKHLETTAGFYQVGQRQHLSL